MLDQERLYNDFKMKLGDTVQCVHLPKSGGVSHLLRYFHGMAHRFLLLILSNSLAIARSQVIGLLFYKNRGPSSTYPVICLTDIDG